MRVFYHKILRLYSNNITRKSLERVWKMSTQGVILKQLSSTQKKNIQSYWYEMTGKKVSCKWHQLLYTLTGTYTETYMPFEIYYDMINTLSPWKSRISFDDKNLYRYLFKDFRIPDRVLECYNNVYYSGVNGGGYFEVNIKEALKVVQDIENCIIKPSRESSSGIGVKSLTVKNGIEQNSQEPIEQFLNRYKNGFCIEKKVEECENLSKLNPSSCNTLRIHTYRDIIDGGIHFASAFLRIGRDGTAIDNANAGGMVAMVKKDGTLEHACTVKPQYQPIEKTDTGIIVNGYKVENMCKVIETAIRAHSCLPMFHIIGWDFAIDKDNNPVIIEFNPDPDMRMDQLWYHDSCLLDHQERVMKLVYGNV